MKKALLALAVVALVSGCASRPIGSDAELIYHIVKSVT
jgi:hypothetical protein